MLRATGAGLSCTFIDVQGSPHCAFWPDCRFEFCWLCQGSWAEHGERTGGFYNCNR